VAWAPQGLGDAGWQTAPVDGVSPESSFRPSVTASSRGPAGNADDVGSVTHSQGFGGGDGTAPGMLRRRSCWTP